MYQRQESNSAREGKLRAACDRCHDLKNRCVRTGGPDSRCDRCERLNIDCVYRTNSRTGRPRAHRRPPASELAPTRDFRGSNSGERRVSYPMPTTSTSTKAGRVHARPAPSPSSGNSSPDRSTDTAGLPGELDQNQVERRNTPRQSRGGQTPEVLQLSIAAPEVQQADLLDWSLDFSAHVHADMANNAFDETMFPDPGGQDSGALPESEAFSFLNSDDMGSGPTAQEIGSTTDRLLQLQIQLHHLSVTTDQATAMNQPAAEEVLEATKSFLEILQASLAAQSCIPQPISAIASTADAVTGWDDPKPAAMSYITVLQVLTCYSYVLHVLDPVVSALIIQKAESTVRTAEPCRAFSNAGHEKSSQTALSMGFFNLASQPAMNADVVLHIILRMIQQLRLSIHLLASGHRDPVDEISDRVGIGSPAVDTTRKLHATPISISSQPIVKLISAREEPLVERLSHLMNGQ